MSCRFSVDTSSSFLTNSNPLVGFNDGAGVEAARAGRSGVPSPHSVSPEYDRTMLTADDLGGLSLRPVGGAGVAKRVDDGRFTEPEGLDIFDWNLVCGKRIEPGMGILLLLVVLPIRGIRDCEGSFDIFSSELALQLVFVWHLQPFRSSLGPTSFQPAHATKPDLNSLQNSVDHTCVRPGHANSIHTR